MRNWSSEFEFRSCSLPWLTGKYICHLPENMRSAHKSRFYADSQLVWESYKSKNSVLIGFIPMFQSPLKSPWHPLPAFQTNMVSLLSKSEKFVMFSITFFGIFQFFGIASIIEQFLLPLSNTIISGRWCLSLCQKIIVPEYFSAFHLVVNFCYLLSILS